MKVLFRKIKRANKIAFTIYILSLLMFIASYTYFVISLFKLEGIETLIRGIVIGLLFLWLIIYFLFGLSTLVTKKIKKFLVLTFIHLLLFGGMLFVSVVINRLYSKLEMFTNQDVTLYTTNLIALKNTELTSSSKLGMISNNEDIEGYILANTLRNKENLSQEVEYFDDYYSMLNALYNKEIDATFVSSNYVILFSSEESYANIEEETKVLYDYSEEMKTKTITNSNKKLTEPFTVLLMGVDSEKDGLNANAAFNGDTLMLITFNPTTLNATMLSIPRDTFVPIACNNNRSHKINSSAAYGTECVINTIQNLVDVEIDYYAKINFNGVIDLVNAIGGIDVDVEEPDYKPYAKRYGEGKLCEEDSYRNRSNMVCMDIGMQHLNGEQALAYARNRHGFLESDLARNRHQQQIVEALAKKLMSVSSFSDFEKLLDAIGKNIATNLSTTQILSFYQTLKNMLVQSLHGNDFINIQKMYLEVYNQSVLMGGMRLSALGYYDNSLTKIKEAMNVNLGLKEEEMVKTFSYDYNEEYTSPIIGKGITSGTKGATVPNFVGSTVRYAEDWANNNNVTLTTAFSCSDGIPGLIGSQSVSAGMLAKTVSSITIYVNQVCDANTNTNDNNTTDNNNNQNNSDDNNTDNNDNSGIDPIIPGGPTIDKPGDNSNNEGNGNDSNNGDNNEGDDKPPVTIPGMPEEDEN